MNEFIKEIKSPRFWADITKVVVTTVIVTAITKCLSGKASK